MANDIGRFQLKGTGLSNAVASNKKTGCDVMLLRGVTRSWGEEQKEEKKRGSKEVTYYAYLIQMIQISYSWHISALTNHSAISLLFICITRYKNKYTLCRQLYHIIQSGMPHLYKKIQHYSANTTPVAYFVQTDTNKIA